jgi:hypothetical protein
LIYPLFVEVAGKINFAGGNLKKKNYRGNAKLAYFAGG